jgi:hypothetical protein
MEFGILQHIRTGYPPLLISSVWKTFTSGLSPSIQWQYGMVSYHTEYGNILTSSTITYPIINIFWRILCQQLSFHFENFDKFKINIIIKLSSLSKVFSCVPRCYVLANFYSLREGQGFESDHEFSIIWYNKLIILRNFTKLKII